VLQRLLQENAEVEFRILPHRRMLRGSVEPWAGQAEPKGHGRDQSWKGKSGVRGPGPLGTGENAENETLHNSESIADESELRRGTPRRQWN
jgi:hypothetical protein